MVKKKRVILTFVPTNRNLLILQNMGFLNKHNRSRGRLNLAYFINRAIHEKVGIDDPSQNAELLEKILRSEIQAEHKRRDKASEESEVKLRALVSKLEDIMHQRKVGDYYENKESED